MCQLSMMHMLAEKTTIAIPHAVIAQVDDHILLFGSFRSRQELIAYAVLDFLERVERYEPYSS